MHLPRTADTVWVSAHAPTAFQAPPFPFPWRAARHAKPLNLSMHALLEETCGKVAYITYHLRRFTLFFLCATSLLSHHPGLTRMKYYGNFYQTIARLYTQFSSTAFHSKCFTRTSQDEKLHMRENLSTFRDHDGS